MHTGHPRDLENQRGVEAQPLLEDGETCAITCERCGYTFETEDPDGCDGLCERCAEEQKQE